MRGYESPNVRRRVETTKSGADKQHKSAYVTLMIIDGLVCLEPVFLMLHCYMPRSSPPKHERD